MSRRHRDRGHSRTHHRPDSARSAASPRLSVRPESQTAPDTAHIEAPADSGESAELESAQAAEGEAGRAATGAAPFDADAKRDSPTGAEADQADVHAEVAAADVAMAEVAEVEPMTLEPMTVERATVEPLTVEPAGAEPAAVEHVAVAATSTVAATSGAAATSTVEAATTSEPRPIGAGDRGLRPPGSCTPAQLRRFIKSRPWIPMHELRRRFAINGPDDEVTRVEVEGGSLFVGLPAREGQILGDLVRAGEVGYELSRDPTTPVIVGVYPMRPVPRL